MLSEARSLNNCSDYMVFHWLLFFGQIRLCTMYVRKQIMKQFLSWRYERFLFHLNFISYHWLQFISVQTDSFRVRSESIRMYVRIILHSVVWGEIREYITRNLFFISHAISRELLILNDIIGKKIFFIK